MAAEKRRYLQDVDHLARRFRLPRLMNIGGKLQAVIGLHIGKHPQSLVDTWAAERAQARAVGLVETRLEDDVGAEAAVYVDQRLCYGVEKLGRLYYARPGYQPHLVGPRAVVALHVVILLLVILHVILIFSRR